MLTTLSSLPIEPISHPLSAAVRVPGTILFTNRAFLSDALPN
jgi:hypothetical protein